MQQSVWTSSWMTIGRVWQYVVPRSPFSKAICKVDIQMFLATSFQSFLQLVFYQLHRCWVFDTADKTWLPFVQSQLCNVASTKSTRRTLLDETWDASSTWPDLLVQGSHAVHRCESAKAPHTTLQLFRSEKKFPSPKLIWLFLDIPMLHFETKTKILQWADSEKIELHFM